jgi:hypothetical protein
MEEEFLSGSNDERLAWVLKATNDASRCKPEFSYFVSYCVTLLYALKNSEGPLDLLCFLFEFLRKYKILPILEYNSLVKSILVEEMLVETSVDITDKSAIRAIEKLTE